MKHAIVVGAGIGGLTAGLALARDGWQVQVLERASQLRPVGVAIVLAPNALRALGRVSGELVDELRAESAIQGAAGVRDHRGRWLTRDDPDIALARYGYPALAAVGSPRSGMPRTPWRRISGRARARRSRMP